MPIFHVSREEITALSETSFGAEGILERQDIQRLIRQQIAVLDDRLMVVAEEFGEWLDSSRRIDLLCIDSEANLVVVELKRADGGSHMELQALRYAAMVSAMTFEQLVEAHARHRSKAQPDVEAARASVLEFLGWDDVYEDQFAQDTHIILAAADFSKELTTTVMWLIEHGIEIRCIRMKPYRTTEGSIFLDVQQLIPLPEATDFQTQIGVKKQAERQNRSERHDLRVRFWEGLLDLANTKTDLHANRKPTKDNWISAGIGRTGFSLTYTVRMHDSQVELWISLGSGLGEKNLAAFKTLESEKAAIESDFGGRLDWQELPDKEGCRIRGLIDGGYRSPPDQWPEIYADLTDSMVRLERTMRSRVASLRI